MKKTKIIACICILGLLFTGCGNAADLVSVDPEQFKCSDSVENVFAVLGAKEMTQSKYENKRYCEYEEVNIWGNKGSIVFALRDDEDTVCDFYCMIKCKDIKALIAQLTDRYGPCTSSSYGGQTTYGWEFEESPYGFSKISLQDKGNGNITVHFSDEWSLMNDDAYRKYLEGDKKKER